MALQFDISKHDEEPVANSKCREMVNVIMHSSLKRCAREVEF